MAPMRLELEHADKVPEWRRRAQKLRALAKITHRTTERAELTELAEQWEGLAARAEQRLRQRLRPGR